MSTQDDIDTRITEAELEISLATGVLEWAETLIPKGWVSMDFLKDQISHRVSGLEDALITFKRIKENGYEAKRNG